jgi:hypothetical protein
MKTKGKITEPVSDSVFKAIYDSPASVPGRHKWLTRDQDVRQIEKLLGMPQNTIGAPLWASGVSSSRWRNANNQSWQIRISSNVRNQGRIFAFKIKV